MTSSKNQNSENEMIFTTEDINVNQSSQSKYSPSSSTRGHRPLEEVVTVNTTFFEQDEARKRAKWHSDSDINRGTVYSGNDISKQRETECLVITPEDSVNSITKPVTVINSAHAEESTVEEEAILEVDYKPGMLGHNPFSKTDREQRFYLFHIAQYVVGYRAFIIGSTLTNIGMAALEVSEKLYGVNYNSDSEYSLSYALSLRAYQLLHTAIFLYLSRWAFVQHFEKTRFLYFFILGIDLYLISARGRDRSFGIYTFFIQCIFALSGMHLMISSTLAILISGTYILTRIFFTNVAVWDECTPEMIAAWNGSNEICDLRNTHLLYDLIEYVLIMFMVILTMLVSVSLTNRNARYAFLKREQLNVEQKRTNALLNTLLPPSIAAQLITGVGPRSKINQGVIAQKFASASLLFCEISNFKALTMDANPVDLILLLNTIFLQFDRLTERYHVYKVETVGEIYVVASGLPDFVEFPALELCALALEMRTAASLLRTKNSSGNVSSILTRMGIHSGELVAGTVGTKLPRYRLFGDTINTTSRMESNAIVGTIQLSKMAYLHVGPLKCFRFSPRGAIHAKGKGYMYTYHLEGHLDPSKEVVFCSTLEGNIEPASAPFQFPDELRKTIRFQPGTSLAKLFPTLTATVAVDENEEKSSSRKDSTKVNILDKSTIGSEDDVKLATNRVSLLDLLKSKAAHDVMKEELIQKQSAFDMGLKKHHDGLEKRNNLETFDSQLLGEKEKAKWRRFVPGYLVGPLPAV